MRHVESILAAGPRAQDTPEGQRHVQDYLMRVARGCGHHVEREVFGPGVGDVNICVEVTGRPQGGAAFEVVAHYDTVSASPGADDNAVSLGALLTMAEDLTAATSGRPLRLCFVGGEETGRTGSRAHIEKLRQAGTQPAGSFVLEMIGYRSFAPRSQRAPFRIPGILWPPTRGDFVALVSDFRSRHLGALLGRYAERAAPRLPSYHVRLGGLIKDAARSDNASYWAAGIPSVMVTDTGNFRNPHYHKASDTIETIDFDFAAQIAEATLAAIAELSSDG